MAGVDRRQLLTLAGLAAVYVGAGKLGLSVAFVNAHASALWPPSGIALAAALLIGPRVWPAVLAGAFIINFSISQSFVASAAIGAGNTLEALAGAALVTRFAGGAAAFESARNTIRFALLECVGSTPIAAAIGALTLAVTGLASANDLAAVFLTWWVGDVVGVMLVAPPIILWRSGRPGPGRHPLEAVLLLASAIGVSAFVFGESPLGTRAYPLEFMTLTVLLWAAFRFGAFAASITAAAISAVAVWGTLGGHGPFSRSSPNESLLLLQVFMGVASTMTLAVAAEVAGRRRASAALEAVNDSLEARVASRTEELVKLRDRLAEAQAVAHVGSWEWDIDADRVWWSDELYRIYGVPADRAPTYENFLSRVHADDRDRIDATVRRALGDGQPFAFEHRIVRDDGSVRTLFARGRVALDGAGRGVRMSGVAHDVTELKQAEEERAQLIREQAARREAEEANRAKDQFLATLSHELRTPMNAVLGWAHLLRELPHEAPRSARALDAIVRNVTLQAQLVSDILDVSRITAGNMTLEIGAVSLASVVDDAVETVRHTASSRGVAIHVERPPDPTCVLGDATRLQQVVWNLLTNAVKFVEDGGRVDVALRACDEGFELVVEDDGPGIAPEFLPHVFDRFRQADESVTREHGGLGIGLAIVRHIVELHGGSVAASNRTPRGARFTVRLPLAPAAASRERASVVE